VSQAAVKNGFDIIDNYIANVAVPEEDHESDARACGRPVFNFYYFQVPDRGWRGNADSAQSCDSPNLTHPSSGTDNPPRLETSGPYNTDCTASPVRDGNDEDEGVETANTSGPRRTRDPRRRTRLRVRSRTPSSRHGLGLALLSLITTLAPSVDGPTFSSTPKIGPHGYAIGRQYGPARQELHVAHVTANPKQCLSGVSSSPAHTYGWIGQQPSSGFINLTPATLGVFASLDRF
jgi:hypothetical protein